MAKSSRAAKSGKNKSTVRNSRTTVSGPAEPDASGPGDILAEKAAGTQDVASAFPFNPNKAAEYDPDAALAPPESASVKPADPIVGASTVSERNGSDKAGSGGPNVGQNPTVGPLDHVRVDSTDRALTTNQGVPVADNQNSLKAGLRGPTLLEDFILREKITHFDHERIPERIVHARGSAAHGFFECTKAIPEFTRASLLGEVGKQTPVFVRFSTVLGERGSTDTARDVRGFAVKFYTDEGNWDLVGNNMPVFFIQDAMKFPDLVHAAKPEPHFAMPQAGTAHDTFWDFASLMPEISHMLMWAMSDRAIPRSYRMMQGFGVHTYRLVNADGASQFVKFHWNPKAGTHSLVWDEAVKISGADSDFHRRDLWEAIEAGAYPEWELGLQIFTQKQAEDFTFDVLDATKIVPEELVPIVPVGRMVLNRNPDNFFAETEQVAFCVAHVVPGIDFSNDPLLAGRIHSYVDTQISRLGGPNFHEIPINAPIAQVHNNQRDGVHRQAINRGRVSYEPNSLGGGCPFQAGAAGFVSFPEPREEDDHKVRGKAERFADHYTQATLFWNSQTEVEKQHIINAFRFELSRVQTPAIRERMVSGLMNVATELAENVAAGLGIGEMPAPMPKVLKRDVTPEVSASASLSLFARPGDGSIRTRRVAIMVADGCDGAGLVDLANRLASEGAVPRFVSTTLGSVQPAAGDAIEVDTSLEAAPAVLYDALVLPGGDDAVGALRADGRTLEFIKDQYRHCKPILAFGAGEQLLRACGIDGALPGGKQDPGLIIASDTNAGPDDFVAAIATHRHFARETDPPRVWRRRGGNSTNGRDSTMAEMGTLHDAFIDELRDTYDAEKQLTKALPKLAKAATNAKLRTAFETHLQETQGQIARLEQVFQSLDEPVRGKHCDGIAGIIEEGKSVMEEDFDENTMDACLIASGQRAEHYEMAAYGTLVAWAQAMGHSQAAKLLQQTLDEETAADKKLSGLAEGGINQGAADAAHADEDAEEPVGAAPSGAGKSAAKGRRR